MCDVHAAALPPSIALVVHVRPSRYLRALLIGCALVHISAALFIASHLSHFAMPWLLVSAFSGAAVLCTASACQRLNLRQIDISKTGAVRLTVQQKLPDSGREVRLLPGSLLWRQVMVLRLGSVDEAASPVQTVLVLPDSTDRESFRALAVAMRTIASRSTAALAKID